MKRITVILVSVAACLCFAAAVSAELKICNESSSDWIRVAVAWGNDQAMNTIGWWELPKGECQVMESAPLKEDTNYYYYAYSFSNNSSWGGDNYYCVRDTPFTLENAKTCPDRKSWLKGFRKIDTAGKTVVIRRLTSNQ